MNGTAELLEAAAQGDEQACEQMLRDNSGLIWSIVRRYYGRGVEPDDLYQLGCLGFIKAVKGFDITFGTQFSTYAVPKIAGEIRRFLRDDGQVKVSRSLKERAAQVHQARMRLTGSLGREPLVSELAAELALTPEEIAAAETATSAAESIQRESGEEGFSLEDVLCTDGMEDRILESIALRDALSHLTERERLVVNLHYFHGLTQQKIASLLGVSQVQVSRIEKKALGRLRQYL